MSTILLLRETSSRLLREMDAAWERIYAHFDKETGLTMLTVDSYEPALSKRIADTLLARTEAFINTLNQVVADQQLVFVSSEIQRAEKRVKDVSLEILDLQNSKGQVKI